MGVRIRYTIEVAVSSTSAEERDLGNLAVVVVDDGSGEGGSRKTLLAVGATDVSVMMTEISDARFLFIRTNPSDPTTDLEGVVIKKNSVGGEEIALEPLPNAKQAHLLLSTSGITDLFATNPGTADVEITVLAVGD